MHGFRFRFYPTLKQRRYLLRAFGTTRHVFNWGLAIRRDAYSAHKKTIGFVQLSRMLTASKTEKPWLAKTNRQMQTQALRDLDRAYENFFKKRAGFPRFRKRHGAQSVRCVFDRRHAGRTRAWAKRRLVLPGIGECRIADSLRSWPQSPAMVTVRRDVCGDYWISYATETPALEAAPQRMIGVDVGITDLAVTSDGWKSGQITKLKDKAAQLRRYRSGQPQDKRQQASQRGEAPPRQAPSQDCGCAPGLQPQGERPYRPLCKSGRDRNAECCRNDKES